MPIVRAFKAIRPASHFEDKVAALPYDVMNSDEARKMVEGNPYSFLHVDKAEVDLDKSVNVYDEKVYLKARENLCNMVDKKIMIKDGKPYLYIYRQIMNGKEQTGVVGCTSIDDYINDIIKKHENTRAEKEKDRINHVDYCNANTGPIFLTYRHDDDIDNIINDWIKDNEPIYNFTSEDGIGHIVWIINDDNVIKMLVELFKKVDCFYIADGHHRCASAVKVGLKRRKMNPNYNGNEEFNFFLSVMFPDNELHVMDYNRVVKDLNGLSMDKFMDKVKQKFDVKLCEDNKEYRPTEKHTFGMFIDSKWYKLRAKEDIFDKNDPVDRLDVSILQNNLLYPILGIKNPKKDERIDFIGGIRGLKELERRVKDDMTVAFSMYPTTTEDLMSIADAKRLMPPKSTWFEPKLRSGLFIHSLK